MSRLRTLSLSALAGLAASIWAAPGAVAQSTTCADGQKFMEQRGSLIQSLGATGKKKMTPVQACGKFNALVANGTKLLAWLEQNGAWCNVPEPVKTRITDDHKQAQTIRGQACTAATKQRQMQAQAARAARQGGSGAPSGFGGNGGDLVSGAMRVPQGAL